MTLAETINKMIETAVRSLKITSASPGHTNIVTSIDELDTPDLEEEISSSLQQDKEIEKTKSPFQSQAGDNIEKIDTQTQVKEVLDNPSFTPSKNFSGKVFKSIGVNPQQLIGAMKNPAGFQLGLLGRIGAPIAGFTIVAAMAKQVWEWMIGPGGPLDIRVKIIARDEAFAMLDRQTRQNTRIGDRQVIIQQFQGFRNFEGYASTNTSKMIRENADRVLDIGLFDRAQGVMLGGK